MLTKQFVLLSVIICLSICSGAQQPSYGNFTNKTIITDSFPPKCDQSDKIEKIINDAIALGAPIYNSGYHIGCYRIYDCAAYKILYLYGDKCKDVKKILKASIDKCTGDYSDIEKAWIMRAAFDLVLGVPTITEPKKIPDTKS